jgi:hypothetical protein
MWAPSLRIFKISAVATSNPTSKRRVGVGGREGKVIIEGQEGRS